MTAHERFDWIWYGVNENGDSHVSLGRWQKHPCQFRYKFAEIQPTEHDHPTRATPAAMTPEVRELVEAAKEVGRISDRDHVAWRRLADALAAFREGKTK